MKKKTKEKIVSEWEAESSDRILDTIEYNERVVYPSMIEFASQQQPSNEVIEGVEGVEKNESTAKQTAKEIFKKVCLECNIRDCSARFESCMIIAMKEYANQQQPSRKRIQTEVKDILECIVKFDKTATVKEKARYFDVIQKDLEDCQPELSKGKEECKHPNAYRNSGHEDYICDDCDKSFKTYQDLCGNRIIEQPEQPDNSLRELEKILNDYMTDEEIGEISDALKALKPLDKQDKQDSATAFVESCGDMTEYVAGKKIAHRFRKYTIPVIEYNELRKAAKDFDNEQNQPKQSEGEEENGGMFIDETGFHKQQNKIDMKELSVYESNIPLGRDKCWYCGELLFPSTRTVDHFWPKCMRGRLKVVCCSNCNKMKGRLTPLGFINLLESLKEKYPLYQPWQKKFDRMIRATQTLWERVKWSV